MPEQSLHSARRCRGVGLGTLAAAAVLTTATAASADVTYEFVEFTAEGFEYVDIFAAGELTGTLTGVGVDAVLVADGENFTWANDLSILVGNADFSTINLQAGGFSNTGADEKISWSNGSSGSAGTTVVDSQSLATPLDMSALTVFLGNGYGSGGLGIWTGSITLYGVDSTACLSDIDGNGLVNAGDLGTILGDWGDPCCGSDIDGDGDVNAADIAALLADWGATCGPVIDSIDPAAGSSAGGTEVTIIGRHLAAATSVSFGGGDAEIVSASGDAIVVVTPPGTVGPAEVEVATPFGMQTLSDAFEYVSPLPWATVLETAPDPKIITDPEWRDRIIATGLPWRVQDNASQIEMLLVPPGTFMMGCSASNQSGCDSDESPVHEVTLTQAFYLGRYEVTQAEWGAVMGYNPSEFRDLPDSDIRPVEKVSWNAVQGFEMSTGLRLPTEAEWEFACRAGTSSAYHNGSDDPDSVSGIAWFGWGCAGNSGGQTHPVGERIANRWGFHDMLGNVSEWVEDNYSSTYYEQTPILDPPGPTSGQTRVLRGGDWDDCAVTCRVSNRFDDSQTDGTMFGVGHGFRVARSP